jgi:hypothetical protein
MRKLIGKVNTESYGYHPNPKTLYIYENESGTVGYSYTNSRGTSFAVSNMQTGYKGPELPDCIYDYKNPFHLLRSVVKAVNGGVVKAVDSKLYNKKFKFAN